MTTLASFLRAIIVVIVAVTSSSAKDIGASQQSAPQQTAPQQSVPDALSGNWSGAYQCAQGQTAVTVTLALESGGTVSGTFSFGNLPGQTNAKEGEYRIVGMFDAASGQLRMQPNGWIKQPAGYLPVGFAADLDAAAKRLTGHIEFAGCSTISLDRLKK